MSKLEKAKIRIKSLPSDYTYSEARTLLCQLGFSEFNKGRTSGSRVQFYREADQEVVLLHKPHPGDVMKQGAVKQLFDFLTDLGEL